MEAYHHRVQYYETDKMGITHHSNYIRWMEEARVDFLSRIGWDYERLEASGIFSPVMAVDCKYRRSTTFADDVYISVTVEELRGVRLRLRYDMKNADGVTLCEAHSEHCFLDAKGRVVRIKKDCPELYAVLSELVPPDDGAEENAQTAP